jgi:predicted nucleic acid-binding protein
VSDFIVDASVAVKWFVAETDSLVADELSASRHRLFAPGLIMAAAANALRFSTKIAGTDFARHVTLLSDWRPE